MKVNQFYFQKYLFQSYSTRFTNLGNFSIINRAYKINQNNQEKI